MKIETNLEVEIEIVKDFYFSGEILKTCSEKRLFEIIKKYVMIINDMDIDTILKIISENRDAISIITTKNIPQFSDINCIDKVLKIVNSSVEDLDYRKIGYFFNKDGSEGAQRKYGENHYKLVAAMGLASEQKPFKTSALYEVYKCLSKKDQEMIKPKLLLRIPIVQTICVFGVIGPYSVIDLLTKYLSFSTAIRRRSSIKCIIKTIAKNISEEAARLLETNLEWGE